MIVGFLNVAMIMYIDLSIVMELKERISHLNVMAQYVEEVVRLKKVLFCLRLHLLLTILPPLVKNLTFFA